MTQLDLFPNEVVASVSVADSNTSTGLYLQKRRADGRFFFSFFSDGDTSTSYNNNELLALKQILERYFAEKSQ